VGVDTARERESKPVPGNIWIPALVFTSACLIFLFVAFFTGVLKPDQRHILNAIFPLLVGFATFFIGGTAFVKLTGNLGGLRVLFTGTAGVALFVFVFLHPIFTDETDPCKDLPFDQRSISCLDNGKGGK
jgi:hypothetical protein